MKITQLPILILAVLAATLVSPVARAQEPEKLVTIVASDSLKFSVTRIDAKPGQRIHVQLRNEGTMPKDPAGHDWVLLKAGTDPMGYAMSAMSAKADGFQPKSLASEVIAPMKPGHYPYICSCSGHSMAGMCGELIVK
jgi:azurin